MSMRTALLSTALLSTTMAWSGPAAAEVAVVGLKGGMSLSTLHGPLPTDGLVENGWRLGAGGGVSLAIDFGSRILVQPEVLFVAKGTTLGSTDLTDSNGNVIATADVTQTSDYLEIPVLARIAIPTGGLGAPYLLAGPAVGLRLSQRVRISGGASYSFDVDYVKSADLGVALGAGIDMGRGRARWSIESRYTLGLTAATDASYSDRARNGDLLVLAGLAIHR
jgi:hypothetical protein